MRSRIAEFALLILTLLIAALGALWALLVNPLQHMRPPSTEPSESARARQYVLQRPFDAAGWLGWQGAAAQPMAPATPASASAGVIAAAATLAPADPLVMRARAQVLLAAGDEDAALNLLERVALLFPDERANAFAAMTAATSSAAFNRFVSRALQRNSPVIDEFLMHACSAAKPLQLLAPVAEATVKVRPLPDAVLDCVCERAISANAVPFARWLWLNGQAKLPATIGFVQNGGFDDAIGQRPFDWHINAGGQFREGFTARVQYLDSDPKSKNHVLSVSFNGRPVRVRIARQTLALSEGRYELRFRYNAAGLKAPLQYAWTLRCLGDQAQALASVAPPVTEDARGWQLRAAEFAVPPACTGQELSLELAGKLQQETGGRGTVLFDDIVVTQR